MIASVNKKEALMIQSHTETRPREQFVNFEHAEKLHF